MPKEHNPKRIQEKMNAGLTRDQAIQALDRQAEHDTPTKQRKPPKGQQSDKSD